MRLVLDRLCCDSATGGDSDEVHFKVIWALYNPGGGLAASGALRIPAGTAVWRLKEQGSSSGGFHCLEKQLIADLIMGPGQLAAITLAVWEGGQGPQVDDAAVMQAANGCLDAALSLNVPGFLISWGSGVAALLPAAFANNDPIGIMNVAFHNGQAAWSASAANELTHKLISQDAQHAEFRLYGQNNECDYVARLHVEP